MLVSRGESCNGPSRTGMLSFLMKLAGEKTAQPKWGVEWWVHPSSGRGRKWLQPPIAQTSAVITELVKGKRWLFS